MKNLLRETKAIPSSWLVVAAAHAHVRDVAEQKHVVNFRRQQGICR